MTGSQDQFAELTRRTQENFKHLWEQWSQRSNELLKGMGSRSRSMATGPGTAEEVLDAVFDFAENLIAQQRAFAKQMLRATGEGQQVISDSAGGPAAATTGGRHVGYAELDHAVHRPADGAVRPLIAPSARRSTSPVPRSTGYAPAASRSGPPSGRKGRQIGSVSHGRCVRAAVAASVG